MTTRATAAKKTTAKKAPTRRASKPIESTEPQPAPGANGAWAGNGEAPPNGQEEKPQTRRAPRKRVSGKTAGEESADEAGQALENPVEPGLPEERARKWRTPGFARMRTEWAEDDGFVWARIQKAAQERLQATFPDAFDLMADIYFIVRDPVLGDDGQPKIAANGLPDWKRGPNGTFIEDYSKLTHKQKDDAVFQITTRLFKWEQRAADLWGEAMFAKAMFEERYAIDHTAPMSGTISDREAEGTKGAAEEKYFAVLLSYSSRKAEALVRAMSLLGQRLRDSLVSG